MNGKSCNKQKQDGRRKLEVKRLGRRVFTQAEMRSSNWSNGTLTSSACHGHRVCVTCGACRPTSCVCAL